MYLLILNISERVIYSTPSGSLVFSCAFTTDYRLSLFRLNPFGILIEARTADSATLSPSG